MAKKILLSFIVLWSIGAVAQSSKKEKDVYNKFKRYNTKTVKIRATQESYHESYICGGILVRKNNKIYLVTCFHCLSNRNPKDTSQYIADSLLKPTWIVVYFHSSNNGNYIPYDYPLTKPDGSYAFYTIPAVKETRWDSLSNPRQVSDLVFLPLDIIPEGVKIDTTNIYKENDNKKIKRNSTFSIWGFRDGLANNDEYPICDTFSAPQDSTLRLNNKYLYGLSYKNLHGDSGAPVYVNHKNELQFVGIESAEIRQENLFHFPYFKNKKYKASVNIFISKSFIRYALATYVE